MPRGDLEWRKNRAKPPLRHVPGCGGARRTRVTYSGSGTILHYVYPCGHESEIDHSECPDHFDEATVQKFATYWGRGGVTANCPTCKLEMKRKGFRFARSGREIRMRNCNRRNCRPARLFEVGYVWRIGPKVTDVQYRKPGEKKWKEYR